MQSYPECTIENSLMKCSLNNQQYIDFSDNSNYDGGYIGINIKVLYPDKDINIIGYYHNNKQYILKTFRATTEFVEYIFPLPRNPNDSTYKFSIQEVSQGYNIFYIKSITYYPPYIPLNRDTIIEGKEKEGQVITIFEEGMSEWNSGWEEISWDIGSEPRIKNEIIEVKLSENAGFSLINKNLNSQYGFLTFDYKFGPADGKTMLNFFSFEGLENIDQGKYLYTDSDWETITQEIKNHEENTFIKSIKRFAWQNYGNDRKVTLYLRNIYYKDIKNIDEDNLLPYKTSYLYEPDVILSNGELHWKEESWGTVKCNNINNLYMECSMEGKQITWPGFGFKTDNNYDGGYLVINMKVLNPDHNIEILCIDRSESHHIIYTFKATTKFEEYTIPLPNNKNYPTYRYVIQDATQMDNTLYINSIIYYPPYIPLSRTINKMFGNLALYSRGTNDLPYLWDKGDVTNGSSDAKIYFPNKNGDDSENSPMILYLPGKKVKRNYSNIEFHLTKEPRVKFNINLGSFHKFKSEIKLVAPGIEELKNEGYTCKNIGLSCSDLSEYDFTIQAQEWLSLVDLKFVIEPEDYNRKYSYRDTYYEIENITPPTNEWMEMVGDIDSSKLLDDDPTLYTRFTIRNYGRMPVYIFIGNSIFLKKDPTVMIKNGIIQHGFSINFIEENYILNEVYQEDPEKKNCIKFIPGINQDYGYIGSLNNNGFVAPPEGISIKARFMKKKDFKLRVGFSQYNIISDYLSHRNCDIPMDEEIEFLIDIRSLVYSNPRNTVPNYVYAYGISGVSLIQDTRQSFLERKYQEALNSNDEEDEEAIYFYDFVLHHTYPEDTSKYINKKLSEEGGECRLSLETHEDWSHPDKVNPTHPVSSWPDNISTFDIFNYKYFYKTIDNDDITNNSYDDDSEYDIIDNNSKTVIEECNMVNRLLRKKESYDCCLDSHVTCNEDGHIISIKIENTNGLNEFPRVFNPMPYLEELSISNCNIFGNFFLYAFSDSVNLKIINLEKNQIYSSIPSSFGKLKNLTILKLNDNYIYDFIPSDIGNLTNLKTLHLQNNRLTDNIPSEIGNLSGLLHLSLSNNKLSGEIPTKELEKLTNLVEIELQNNENLYGRVPNIKFKNTVEKCDFSNTSLCHVENDINNSCSYPITHYDCSVCENDFTSIVSNDTCQCNEDEGYIGVGYIECNYNLKCKNVILIDKHNNEWYNK
ncbi:hypothetical protein BCR36DRAFT_73100 [Piromyces finnis]|uniref:Disease resistance R13L4/SHOC-2-like LRR domain-containing protein n=1 Tax=Piromyces finnis TaxID=1754191 RepID=A0A1Y1V829_9FUNG|nr:hypothetical protein BCR36DRAFT_73100 [Piromyces finnis]|eukprot:ORX48690.1 hypothetical protein BCR36DRAFT_73100 [Piromyces finnis]